MHRTHTESFGVIGRAVAKARTEEHPFFAGFTFDGDQSLKELAGFYGLAVPAPEPRITLAEFLARNCHGSPHPGYRIALGNAELIIREMEEGAVTKVGLRLLPPVLRQRRRRWPFGMRYDIGASAARTGRRGFSGVADPPR